MTRPRLRWLTVFALAGLGSALVTVAPRFSRAAAPSRPAIATARTRCQAVTPPPASDAGPTIPEAALDAGIATFDATHHTITRALLDRVIELPMTVAKSARIVPAVSDGRPSGFKLYGIRPRSIAARLGFENGDLIRTVNGYDLASPDHALGAYTALRNAASFEVAVVRHGAPITLVLAIDG